MRENVQCLRPLKILSRHLIHEVKVCLKKLDKVGNVHSYFSITLMIMTWKL